MLGRKASAGPPKDRAGILRQGSEQVETCPAYFA